MKLWAISRKLLAIVALFALLIASTPALAESLSSSESPACCNTAYCPVHHRHGQDIHKDKSDCDARGKAAVDCSMRACEATPNQAAGMVPFILAAPYAIFYDAAAQAVPLSFSAFIRSVISLPSTPPPRIF